MQVLYVVLIGFSFICAVSGFIIRGDGPNSQYIGTKLYRFDLLLCIVIIINLIIAKLWVYILVVIGILFAASFIGETIMRIIKSGRDNKRAINEEILVASYRKSEVMKEIELLEKERQARFKDFLKANKMVSFKSVDLMDTDEQRKRIYDKFSEFYNCLLAMPYHDYTSLFQKYSITPKTLHDIELKITCMGYSNIGEDYLPVSIISFYPPLSYILKNLGVVLNGTFEEAKPIVDEAIRIFNRIPVSK